MKIKYILVLFSCFLFVSAAIAQPKPKKTRPSKNGSIAAKELIVVLTKMYKDAKFTGKSNMECDPLPYLEAIGKSKLVPRKWELGRKIDVFFKELFPEVPGSRDDYIIHRAFVNTKSYEEFHKVIFEQNPTLINFYREQSLKAYNHFKSLYSDALVIQKKSNTNSPCGLDVETKIFLKEWSTYTDQTKSTTPRHSDFIWNVKTTVKIKCNCNMAWKLQDATFEFSGSIFSTLSYKDGQYKMKSTETKKPVYSYKLLDSNCCPTKTPKAKDGSFMDPNEDEDISFPNQVIEVGAGVTTAKDEETELCASVGFMHNLLPGEDNALFIGGRASVHNASFSGPDFSQTTINVGPAAEFQTFIGDTSTKWINGVNGAFVFGSQNSGEFKTDISGINIGLYTGVEVPLGNQFALGVMANLISFNNLTFKTDEGEFKSNSTGINLNKGSVGLSLRIDLDSNN